MHALENLARFVADHRDGAIPPSTRSIVALLVADLVGAAAAGLESPLARAARAACLGAYGDGDASLWLTSDRAGIAGAAMANAAAASALDIDDGHRGAAGHPGAGIIPAVLALGQSIGASDERIFDAIALGYDIALRIAASRPKATIETYCSGRWLGFGVAAASGRLLGLDAAELSHAMAIAGAESPVILPHSMLDSTVKEGIPPAVVAGLTAAFRARAGATGPIDLIDDEAQFVPDVLSADLGERWWLEQCYLKPYACCRYMHAALDAILAMREPDKPIVSLRIETFAEGLRLVNERAPRTPEAAQYSYYFAGAVAAVHGAPALQPMAGDLLQDPDVLALAARIELVAHDEFADAFPGRTPCRVFLDQGDGPRQMTVQHPLGDVANPMSRRQVFDKIRRISARVLPPDAQESIIFALDGLADQGFAPLFEALATPPARARGGASR